MLMSWKWLFNHCAILESIGNWSIPITELQFLVDNQTYIYEVIAHWRKWDKCFKWLFDIFTQQRWKEVMQRNDVDDAKLGEGIVFAMRKYWLEYSHEPRKVATWTGWSLLITRAMTPEIQSIFGDPDDAVSQLKQLVTDYKSKEWNRWVLLLLWGDSCIGKWETTNRLVKYLNDERENSAFTISLWNVFRAIRRRIILDRKLDQVDGSDTADKLKKIVMDEQYMKILANDLNYIDGGPLDGKNVTRQWDNLDFNTSIIPDYLLPIISEYSQHIAIDAARRYISTKLNKWIDVVVEWRDQTLDFFEDGNDKTLRRRLVVKEWEWFKFATARAISDLFGVHKGQLREIVTCKEICEILLLANEK